MTYRVVFAPEADDQLAELYRYIAAAGAPDAAARYTDAIITYCEGLAEFPLRGTARDDIRPGSARSDTTGASSSRSRY